MSILSDNSDTTFPPTPYAHGRASRSFAYNGSGLIPFPYFDVFTACNVTLLGVFTSRLVSPPLKADTRLKNTCWWMTSRPTIQTGKLNISSSKAAFPGAYECRMMRLIPPLSWRSYYRRTFRWSSWSIHIITWNALHTSRRKSKMVPHGDWLSIFVAPKEIEAYIRKNLRCVTSISPLSLSLGHASPYKLFAHSYTNTFPSPVVYPLPAWAVPSHNAFPSRPSSLLERSRRIRRAIWRSINH